MLDGKSADFPSLICYVQQTELFRASKSLQALYDSINCNYCAVLAWNDLASIILVKTGEKWKKASVFPVW